MAELKASTFPRRSSFDCLSVGRRREWAGTSGHRGDTAAAHSLTRHRHGLGETTHQPCRGDFNREQAEVSEFEQAGGVGESRLVCRASRRVVGIDGFEQVGDPLNGDSCQPLRQLVGPVRLRDQNADIPFSHHVLGMGRELADVNDQPPSVGGQRKGNERDVGCPVLKRPQGRHTVVRDQLAQQA